MRRRAFRTAGLALLAASALAASGCGSDQPSGAPLTIVVPPPASGPLQTRAADMRRAAELRVESLGETLDGHPLKIVSRADTHTLATILAPGARQVGSDLETLQISLWAPTRRQTRAITHRYPRTAPTLWLVPAHESAREVTAAYARSGAPGGAAARADDPADPGTPTNLYVTAALSRENYPPAGGAFFAKFNERFDRAPDRWAIYAYEAAGLVIDAANRLQRRGSELSPQGLAAEALQIRDRYGAVGHYDILPSGQSTLYVFELRGSGAPDGEAALLELRR